jgi:UDP-3-O-[3-hydroxymyristoyl] glucosamine N-acyltransferase
MGNQMELTLKALADRLSARVIGEPRARIRGAAPFELAGESDITYAVSSKYLRQLSACRAGAVIVPPGAPLGERNGLESDTPEADFVRVARLFHPGRRPRTGVHPTAVLGENLRLGSGVSLGAQVVVGTDVQIGDRSVLRPGCVIGDRVTIGDDADIGANVTIGEDCRLGDRVVIQPGSVIGSDGFGYAADGEGYLKIPHIGIVQLDDDVEIGAGNTIDRATYGRTWLQKGVKTDNLVHIAHNVVVGENTLLVAQVGVSGSVTIGKRVILAGQAGIAGHLCIGDDVRVGAQSGIGKSIPDGRIISGTPGFDHRKWLRVQALVPRLPELKRKIENMEKQLSAVCAKGAIHGRKT